MKRPADQARSYYFGFRGSPRWLVASGHAQTKGNGLIIASDILPMDPIEDVTFIQGDFTEQAVFDAIMLAVNNRPVDLVISDMAPI